MFKKILVTTMFLVLGAHFSFAAMDANDIRKAQQYVPSLYQFEDNTGFGNVLYGYMGVTGNGSLAATSNGTLPITLNTLQLSVNGAGLGSNTAGMTLPNGYEGQSITLVLSTVANSGQVIITPTTKTGFSYIVLAAAGQGCELNYVDTNGQITPGPTGVGKSTGSVTGWVPKGCWSASSSTYPVVHQ